MVACLVVLGGVLTAAAATVDAASGLAASAEAWIATSVVAIVVFAVESSFGIQLTIGSIFHNQKKQQHALLRENFSDDVLFPT